MRADSSEFFTQPPRSINRLLSSVVTFLDMVPCGFSQVVDIQCVSVLQRTDYNISNHIHFMYVDIHYERVSAVCG